MNVRAPEEFHYRNSIDVAHPQDNKCGAAMPLSPHRPLRVGLLFEYGSLNGGEFSMLTTLEHLSAHECHVVAVCPENGGLQKELCRRNIPCRQPFSAADSADLRAQQLEWAAWLNQFVLQNNLDLLHANSLTMARRLGAIAEHLVVPISGHLRDIMKLSSGAIAALNRHSQLAAVSSATRDAIIKQGVQEVRVQTVWNGIDSTRFHPAARTGALHRELGLASNIQLAATIGQICLRKGQNSLAEVATELKDEFPRLHYLLIGQRHSTKQESIDFDHQISQVFASARISDRLHRLGFRNDIPAILHELDLLIHPARQEPLGRVLLEAAACGVPIVATNVGGTMEILRHEESALLVPAGDSDQLTDAVRRMLNDPEFARRCGSHAAEQVRDRFSAEQAALRTLSFWKSALAR